MSEKQRLSASVDAEVIKAGQEAVATGHADSLSAWVNEALHRQLEHDRRLRALDEAIAAYEAEHGEITEADMADAARWARARSVVVPRDSKDVA